MDVVGSVATDLQQGGQPPEAGPQQDVPKPTGDPQPPGGQLRLPVLADSSDRRQQPTGDQQVRVADSSQDSSQDVSRTRPPGVDVVSSPSRSLTEVQPGTPSPSDSQHTESNQQTEHSRTTVKSSQV